MQKVVYASRLTMADRGSRGLVGVELRVGEASGLQVGDPARVAFDEGSVMLPADLSKVGLDGGYLLEEEHQPRVALVCLKVGAVAGLDHGIRRGGRVDVVP